LGVNALELVPVHFDEAQYWAYGQELHWGYYSKPPLVAWAIRAVTGMGADSLFWLRLASPLAHALIGWLIFLCGRRLWDGETGFWAAAGYTAAPGVALSAMLISTDPLLMALWAAALYVHLRAAEAKGLWTGRAWWGALGLLIGLGMLAEHFMIAFALGALGYGLFSARGRDWVAVAIVAVAAVLVMLPNIVWNTSHDFATLAHVAGNADAGRGFFHPLRLAEFAGAQFAVIGPVFLIAIVLAFRNRGAWRDDWGMRLLAWQTLPLLAAMLGLALATGAHANWAAPAYVAGSLMAARWLVTAGGWPALRTQIGIGVAASLAMWSVAGLYAGQAERLTRRLDPFVQMRLGGPLCELALGNMAEEGAEALLSDNWRRLSECMFLGGLGWDEVATWNPDQLPDNHHELVASLNPGDGRAMLLVVERGAAKMAARFHEAREVESGRLATHNDRDVPYEIWVVQGFKGY
jgi:4-amino-4-deoxy-L-arabinose transferase-like glycosyltransferase